MAVPTIVVFQTLNANHGQEKGGEKSDAGLPPPALNVAELKKHDGLVRARYGPKMEDPAVGVLCTEWTSREAAQAYRRSRPAPPPETLLFELLGPSPSDSSPGAAATAALDAPCTEVFTAFGAEDGFVENVGRFVGKVDGERPEGYLGAAFGAAEGGDGDAEGDGGERVVRMVIGWTSKEAHLEAKGRPGAIQENIHELRTLRRAVDLFHVAFKEL